ncbi:MAG: T9SS type A sorting domain-containing protein, partial [Flavipsychrobacter sp.]
DFVGFDSVYRMAYAYNATSPDNRYYGFATYGYGTGIPMVGITIIKAPNDVAGPVPAGSFVALYNDFAMDGNPQVDTEYYNFMNAKFKFGQHIHNDFKGYGKKSSGTGPGPDANYVFPGDPADTSAWSECASQNLVTDRRFVVSTSGRSFLAKQTTEFAFALVITDTDANNYCGLASNKKIKAMADSAWYYFYNSPAPLPANVADINKDRQLTIYPNPAHTTLRIKSGAAYYISPQNIQIIDVLGRVMNISTTSKTSEVDIDISKLPSGVYTLIYHDTTGEKTALFTKQ